MPGKAPLRIVLIDDHSLVRSCLQTALDGHAVIKVVGEGCDGRDAVALAQEVLPHVVLMDIGMPNLNGIDATHRIMEAFAGAAGAQRVACASGNDSADNGNSNGNGNGSGNGRRNSSGNGNGHSTARTQLGASKTESHRPRVLALSMHRRGSYIQEMLQAGASGYLLKTCSLDDVITGIRTVAAGHTYLSPEVANVVVTEYVGGNGPERMVELTRREREVLQLVAEGHPSKNIAESLTLSIKTVESHRQRLMRKLDIYSIAGLTKYALREGLTTLNS